MGQAGLGIWEQAAARKAGRECGARQAFGGLVCDGRECDGRGFDCQASSASCHKCAKSCS